MQTTCKHFLCRDQSVSASPNRLLQGATHTLVFLSHNFCFASQHILMTHSSPYYCLCSLSFFISNFIPQPTCNSLCCSPTVFSCRGATHMLLLHHFHSHFPLKLTCDVFCCSHCACSPLHGAPLWTCIHFFCICM